MRYEGRRYSHHAIVTYGPENKILPLYTNFVNHSPDGFEWGYGGSRPSQLAFAILYHETRKLEFARQNYQRFKREVIQNFHHDSWVIHEDFLKEWMTNAD